METITWDGLLALVRKRPWAYLTKPSILYLDAYMEGMNLVWGFAGLPYDDLNPGAMRNWFRTKYGVETHLDHVGTVCELICERVGDECKALDEFFKLWDEFLFEERAKQSKKAPP